MKLIRRAIIAGAIVNYFTADACRRCHASSPEVLIKWELSVVANCDESGACPVCKRGHLTKRTHEIAFFQQTHKRPVYCRVAVPMRSCAACGFKTLDEGADALMDEAVRRERDKLP